MAFTDFKSIQQVQQTFQIKYLETNYLNLPEIQPSEQFISELKFNRQYLDIFSSEAARCENIIYPILREIYKQYAENYVLWSHKTLNYNEILTGIPDYLFTSRSELGKTVLGLPILAVVEAKQNNFTEGWGQCLAEMVAAQKLNSTNIAIHGVVTDAEVWHFGKLQGRHFIKNEEVFTLNKIGKIFAALDYALNELNRINT
ncbi:MAG: hypothetical protein RL637_778 [Pseudomonadota bacterium]|jgi:hypothetical protein